MTNAAHRICKWDPLAAALRLLRTESKSWNPLFAKAVTHFPVWHVKNTQFSGQVSVSCPHGPLVDVIVKMKPYTYLELGIFFFCSFSAALGNRLTFPVNWNCSFYSCHKDNPAVWEFMVSNKRVQNLDPCSLSLRPFYITHSHQLP